MSTIYQQKGYANREAYLRSLADAYGLKLNMVLQAAALMGPSEDFDGLISTLEDIQYQLGSF